MRRRRSERGLSLLEVVVATSLSLLVLLLAGALVVELARDAEEQVGRPPTVGGPTEIALSLLERDLQDAVKVVVASAGPHPTIALGGGSSDTVVWLVRDGAIYRSVVPSGGGPARTRRVAQSVESAKFEWGSSRVVEVTLRRVDEPSRVRAILTRNVVP